jgi:DNA (cytosine-5)-methyltransferase 1
MKINVADQFCGGGGETTGIIQAARQAGLKIDLAAVNHWQTAIDTHKLNFPEARSYCQDIATLNPLEVFTARDRVDLLWASPECTHHSNARGGRPRSEQGRASAWLILKWLSELRVRRVIIENVPEFLNWGPLGADGQPLKSMKGKLFQAFVHALQEMGFAVEWRLLCAADYGDPTTRTRLFVQAARYGARVVWPEPTHAKVPYARLFPWVPARKILDWSLSGRSIFERKKALASTTMRRIEEGIRRYWGEWAQPFLVRFNNNHDGKTDGERRSYQLDFPLGTLDTSNRYGLVEARAAEPFLVPMYGERNGQEPRTHSIKEPVPTIPASGDGKFGVVAPGAFILHQDAPGRPRGTDEPVPTIRGRNGHGLVQAIIIPYYGTGVPDRITDPLASVTGKDRFALVEGRPVDLDITFRMLQPGELAAAQGFPIGYRFAGNKSEQVKQIGNAVPPGLARAQVLAALAG